VAEAPERPESTDFVGQGEFPAEFDRANWGAALFSYLWVWIYGLKPWIIGLTALILVPILTGEVALLLIDPELLPQTMAVLSPISTIAWWAVIVVFGLRANRIVWEHERRRFAAAAGDPPRPIPLWRYRKSIALWTRLGLGLIALGLVVYIALWVFRPESRPGGWTSWPVSWIPLAVLFLLDRMGIGRGTSQS
jgi:hypothetical protein